jgi:hypothetical protein
MESNHYAGMSDAPGISSPFTASPWHLPLKQDPVGEEGFEPPTTSTQSSCTTGLCDSPMNFLCFQHGMDPMARRVALRWAFKYEPKETKEHKVEKVLKLIRDATGLSKSMSEQIADAYVRGREVARLAIQKNWPVEDGHIVGPNGKLDLGKLPVL